MGSQSSISPGAGTPGSRSSYRGIENDLETGANDMDTFLQRTALYILGEKAQVRGIKLDPHPKAELIPVEYPEPRRIR
jgi:hypothetical protein